MPETLIRKIADVDVHLDDFTFTKKDSSFNAKDFMTKIFGVTGMTTVSSDEYQKAISDFATTASTKTSSKGPPKYLLSGPLEVGGYICKTDGAFLYSKDYSRSSESGSTTSTSEAKKSTLPPLILLHNSMILRPYPWKTNTTLRGDVKQTPGQGSTAHFGSGDENKEAEKYTYEYKNMCFTGPSDKLAEQEGSLYTNGEIVRTPEKQPIEFTEINDGEKASIKKRERGEILSANEASALEFFEERLYKPMLEDIRIQIKSIFKLKKNQPFLIRSAMHRMTEHQLAFARSSLFKKSDWSDVYPENTREFTAIELEWGGGAAGGKNDVLKLIIRSGGLNNVELYKRESSDEWKMIGSPKTLPADPAEASSIYKSLTVYPLGRDLIVTAGTPSTEGTIDKRRVIWHFDDFVNIDESALKVYFYGGETYFQFMPIIHVQEGSLISPPSSPAFNLTDQGVEEEGRFYLKVDYEGKFTYDYVGPVSSTDEVQLPIPTQEDQGIPGSGMGVSTQKGGKQAKRGKSAPFFEYLSGLVSLSKQIIRNVGDQSTDKDVSAFYDKSKNSGSVADNQFKYIVTLKAKAASGFDGGSVSTTGSEQNPVSKRIFSPAVYKVELHIDPPILRISLQPNIPINNFDVKEVTLKQGVQSLTGSVILWNRPNCDNRDTGGIYTFALRNPTNKGFSGVKPITISGGIIGEISQQFNGYVVSRSYSRPTAAESYVTLELADASKRAKDQMAVNLPIFDGWDHMCALYYLGKEAGFLDSQLLFYQNPRTENDKITLKDVIESGGGNCAKRQGGGWAGHVPRFPQAIGPASRVCSLPPSSIFAVLPCNAFREQPAYMFQMGRPLWDCMNEIRNFSGWYLFPNHFGNIVYCPAEAVFGIKNTQQRAQGDDGRDFQRWADQGGGGSVNLLEGIPAAVNKKASPPKQVMEFGEVSGGKQGGAVNPLAYDQFQRNLQVTYGTDHARNTVLSISMTQAQEDPTNAMKYTPLRVIEKQKGWPYNITDPSYIPWMRPIIARSPYWNDLARLQANTKQRLARATMPRATPSFGAWGHAGLFPYDIVLLREDQADEVGVDGVQFIIQEVNKKWDGVSKLFSMDVATEYVDFNKFEWTPHENQGAGIQFGQG